MNKYLCQLLIPASLIAFTISCDNPTSSHPKLNYIDGNTYHCGEAKMTLSIPTGWVMNADTTISSITFKLIGRKLAFSTFQPNFNIIWTEHSGSSDMNTILNSNENQILSSLQNASTNLKQVVQIDGLTVGEIVFNFSMNSMPLRDKQLYIINNNKDIIITFSDLQSNYGNDSLDFQSLENSITFE